VNDPFISTSHIQEGTRKNEFGRQNRRATGRTSPGMNTAVVITIREIQDDRSEALIRDSTALSAEKTASSSFID
jgi:hypothetical protein